MFVTLAQQTDLLLLDAPTTFLDISHRIEVLDRPRGSIIVMVLHDRTLGAVTLPPGRHGMADQ